MLNGTEFLKKAFGGDSKKSEKSDKSKTIEQPVGQKVRLLRILDSFLEEKSSENVSVSLSRPSKCLACGQVIQFFFQFFFNFFFSIFFFNFFFQFFFQFFFFNFIFTSWTHRLCITRHSRVVGGLCQVKQSTYHPGG